MSDQYEFGFYRNQRRRPKYPERLFFGWLLDREVARQVAKLRERLVREQGLTGSWIKEERLHCSLHPMGDHKQLPSRTVYAARLAGREVSMSAFEVRCRFVESFEPYPQRNGKKLRWPIVLRVESNDLFELHRVLGASIKDNGLRAAEIFVPHITLLYGTAPIGLQEIEPIRFVVKEFMLVHSELGLTQYNVLDRWKLRWTIH